MQITGCLARQMKGKEMDFLKYKFGNRTVQFVAAKGTIPAPLIVMNAYSAEEMDSFRQLEQVVQRPFSCLVVSDLNWDTDMCPFNAPQINKWSGPFKAGADAYLEELTGEIIPFVLQKTNTEPSEIIISGYSLAGLFAIYSLYKTDLFSRVVSCSGSLWMPKAKEFFLQHELLRTPDAVYLSIGETESATKNQFLSKGQINTEAVIECLKGRGIHTKYVINPGNHTFEVCKRLVKGLAWILEQ